MLKKFLFGLLTVCLIFTVGEIYLHINRPSLVEFDSELGWKLKSNFSRAFPQATQKGLKYEAQFQTNQHGFRVYGDSNSNIKKILVLGDSFTADAFASNDESWFSVFANNIEVNNNLAKNSINIWAGGAGGYGTLQELLLAKQIKFFFKPDMLILQFCSNDFTDNHLELNSTSFLRQLYLRRPFMSSTGEVKFSDSILAPVYRSYLFQKSRIINKLDSFFNSFEYMYYKGYSKKTDDDTEKKYQKESIEITQMLLVELGKEFPSATKVMVNCQIDVTGPNGDWEVLAKRAGFIPIPHPTEAIQNGLKNGEDLIHSDGGHWNPNGNKLFGEVLYSDMVNAGLIKKLLATKD